MLALILALGALAMNPDLAGSTWHPSSIYSYSVSAEERIYVVFKEDGRISGNGGCNQFFSAYTIDGNTIKIGPIASTKKGCPGKYELETSFFAVLQSASTFEQEGTTLVLYDDEGRKIAELIKADEA